MKRSHALRAAIGAACLVTGTALATPLAIGPGASGSVPNYDGRTPTNTTLLDAACGYFSGASCTTGTSTSALESTGINILLSSGGFMEAAGTTNLNPYGLIRRRTGLHLWRRGVWRRKLSHAFVPGGPPTSVEACGPIFGSEFEGCAATAGTAARSSGMGSLLTSPGWERSR